MPSTQVGRFFALLIAIDGYAESPLSGCLNDIDQVQSFLVSQLGVSSECIHRLEAPGDPVKQSAVEAARLPTYANLVAALQALAGPKVQRGDRVLIYYSGHGSYEQIVAAQSYFEGLVPLDYKTAGLLFDVELNQLLQDIADRSGDLSVILDCCHSAGATRDVALEDSRIRFLELPRALAAQVAATSARLSTLRVRQWQEPEEYTVVAACQADEGAAECRSPEGKTHGMLSYFLYATLAKVPPSALAQLRWSDIWEQVKGALHNARPSQRPMLLGPRERRVFGGPWQPQDTGYALQRSSDGSYRIAAGRLAGLGPGAEIAVYGPEPARFPLLASEADQQARIGVLVVDSVQPAEATARPAPGAAGFDLPVAARGRLIKQGRPDLLRVAVSRNLDPEVHRLLGEKAQWDRFVLLAENDPSAEARIGQYADGGLWIGDDLFGPGAPADPMAPGPMGRVSHADASDAEERSIGLLAGLNHYAQYVVPLRAYRDGGFTLPAQSVGVRVLDCTDSAHTLQMERNASVQHEARRDPRSRRYVIANGAPVAFHLHNTLARNLYVFLLLCNLEGQIEVLDSDVVLNARSGKIFWHHNIIGRPFELVSPDGHAWGIDRLIVIAADQKGMDLRVLHQNLTMNEAIREAIGSRSVRSTAKNPPGLCWTAVQTLIQIGRPGGI
jgi:hypothetical protein